MWKSLAVFVGLVCLGAAGAFVITKFVPGTGPGVTPGGGTAETNAGDPAPGKPLDDWEPPAVAIVLSGEQHGYMEPCGCSLIQLGGMARRMDLMRQLQERGWTLTGLDVGGLLNPKRPVRRQSKLKLQVMYNALREMKYAGIALGKEELMQGLDLISVQNPEELPFVSANADIFPPDVGTHVASRMVTVGDVKIGVTSVFGNGWRDQVVPATPKPESEKTGGEIDIRDPQPELDKVLASWDSEAPALRVLLSHASLEESEALAKANPRFDLVVSAGGPEDPDPKPRTVGKTLLVSTGAKGKHVGVVGLYTAGEPKLKYALVDLDKDRFEQAPKMTELMRYYQEQMQSEQMAANEPAIGHPSGATFVGAAKCGECHTRAYAKWKTSKHAHAFDSLKTGRPGEEATWISRVFDAECLACHVTGWHPQDVLRYESGYVGESATPHLLGQQCENCHGPGSRHVEEEEKWKKTNKITEETVKWRKFHHLDQQVAKDRLCHQCHDPDNSPKFVFEKYWPQVAHPGRD